jgi:N-acylneuraminate cytidylyltransferase
MSATLQPTVIIPMLERRLKLIKLFATDFDGIHTDGTVLVDEHGTESVRCSRKDGLGYAMLAKAGIHACVISKEKNQVVLRRCEKLGIPCFNMVHDGQGKREILKRVSEYLGLRPEHVLYMGDDLNDLEALKFAGVSVSVRDGHPSILETVDIITHRAGGDHAVREVCELLMVARGRSLKF